MSRMRFLGASVVAVLAGTDAAIAADIQTYGGGPTPTQAYSPAATSSWSGPYVGVTAGYGLGGGTVVNPGWIVGAYAGANFQTTGNFVVGIEGDVTFTGKSGTSGGGQTITNPWNTTARGRVGYAADRLMFYGTGGLALGTVRSSDGGAVEGSTEVGWTAGAGVEALLGGRVTGRLEYRYTSYGGVTFATDPSVSYRSNDVMAGVGLKF